MSPMTMYRSVDGRMDDYHLMYLGARAAGGFGLIFPEQVAIALEGRTTPHCAGSRRWTDRVRPARGARYRWWLQNFRGRDPSIGWPEVGTAMEADEGVIGAA